jgi:hypothetical protein
MKASLLTSGDSYFSQNYTQAFDFQPDATLFIHDIILFGRQFVDIILTVRIAPAGQRGGAGYFDEVSTHVTIVRCPPGYHPQEGIDGATFCSLCQDFQYSLDGRRCNACPGFASPLSDRLCGFAV